MGISSFLCVTLHPTATPTVKPVAQSLAWPAHLPEITWSDIAVQRAMARRANQFHRGRRVLADKPAAACWSGWLDLIVLQTPVEESRQD